MKEFTDKEVQQIFDLGVASGVEFILEVMQKHHNKTPVKLKDPFVLVGKSNGNVYIQDGDGSLYKTNKNRRLIRVIEVDE